MNQDEIIEALAKRFGIAPHFRDLSGVERPTSIETKLALLRANGLDVSSHLAMQDALRAMEHADKKRLCDDEIIIQEGSDCLIPIAEPAEWVLKFDRECEREATISGKAIRKIKLSKLPVGIHRLELQSKTNTQSVCIIVAPARSPSVQDLVGRAKIWGVNTALYGLHSSTTRGMGTYRDLGLVAEVLAGMGASFIGINPVHSLGWADEATISPYSPSHRGFLNTNHLDISDLPDLPAAPAAQEGTLDYSLHRREQNTRLRAAYDYFQRNASRDEQVAFAHYREDEGKTVEHYAQFEALSEVHGPDWRFWPEIYRTCGSQACAEFAQNRQTHMSFHIWLQWLADQQMEQAQNRARLAGMPLGLYLDFAVGPRRGAAETWCEGASIAQGVSIGAPPDHLSPAGQNWDLAAYIPEQFKRTGYRSFRSLLARSLRHAGVLRIDHVLGLNRSYWIPDNGAPGGYVSQPCEALLAVVAIEARKSGSIIIGEDLGLVPEGFRNQLHRRGLYSYSVLQYEKDNDGEFNKPEALPEQSLICFSTHDTPTLNGYLHQKDIDWWSKLGWIDKSKEIELRSTRACEIKSLTEMAKADILPTQAISSNDLSSAIHGILATSPVAMVSVQLDDAFGEIEAQNLPGTIDEHPNWQRRSSLPIEDFSTNVALVAISKQMNDAER